MLAELLHNCRHVVLSQPRSNGMLKDAQRRPAHIEIESLLVGLSDGIAKVLGHEPEQKLGFVLPSRHPSAQ